MKKFLISLGGLLTILVLLEIALRIVGFFAQKEAIDLGVDKKDDEEIVVLTVGDSFTYGVGAPKGKDYPSVLEKMFAARGNQKFRVVNYGLAGANSSQIINTLEEKIKEYQPDIIVLLFGGANDWNHWGFDNSTANNILYRIRIYKLFKLLFNNLSDKLSSGDESSVSEVSDDNTALVKLRNEAAENPSSPLVFFRLGDYFMYEKNFDKALEWFKKGVEADPEYFENYYGIIEAYNQLGKNKEAVNWSLKAIADASDEGKDKVYGFIATHYLEKSNIDKVIEYIEMGMAVNPQCRDFYDILLYVNTYDKIASRGAPPIVLKNISEIQKNKVSVLLKKFPPTHTLLYLSIDDRTGNSPYLGWQDLKINKSQVQEWIEEDLLKAIKLTKDNKAALIIQNYPLRGRNWNNLSLAYKQANDVLTEVAREMSIPFVDNKEIFDRLGDFKDDYLEPTGLSEHCNEKGYNLLAENVYNKIIEMITGTAVNEQAAPNQTDVDIQKGIDDYNSELMMNPNSTEALMSRADIFVTEGKFDNAIKDFSKIIELEPKNTMAYNKRGAVKAELKLYNDAISDFNKSIELDPGSAIGFSGRAHVYMDQGNQEKALSDYNKSLELDPNNIDSYNNRGYLKIMLNDFLGAVNDYDKLIALTPDHPLAYNNRGFAKYNLGLLDAALEDIDKSISIFKTNSYAYKNRALVYIKKGDLDKACGDLKKAEELGFTKSYGPEVQELLNKYCR